MGFAWRNESCSDGVGARTAEVGRYEPDRSGLHDMHGNVWEWVQDCRNVGYEGAPSDGSAWESGDCDQRVQRGGSWLDSGAWHLRSALRYGNVRVLRSSHFGFRLAQD